MPLKYQPIKGYFPIFAGAGITNLKTKDGKVDQIDACRFAKQSFRDDIGENISKYNRSLNEMTAIYWVWKHYYEEIDNPDYIGICHYRRYFIFNRALRTPREKWLPNSSTYVFKTMGDVRDYIDIEEARQIINSGYKCIATRPYDARLLSESVRSCKDRFYEIANFDKNLYDVMEKAVLNRDVSYAQEVSELQNQPSHFLCNMFVFSRSVFFKYCDFIFPILFEINKKNSKENGISQRGPGYLSEYLTSMFISHEIRTNNLTVKELDIAYVKDPSNYEKTQGEDSEYYEFSISDKIKIQRYDKLTSWLRKVCCNQIWIKKIFTKILDNKNK